MTRPRRADRLFVSALEPRRLLSSVTLADNGTLTVVADAAENFVQITPNGPLLAVLINGVTTNRTLANVQRINITTANGADTIAISGFTLGVAIDIKTYDGNDTITYSAGSTALPVIDAGAGTDTFNIQRNSAVAYTVPLGLERVNVTGNSAGVTVIGNTERNEISVTSSGGIAINAMEGDDYVQTRDSISGHAIIDGGSGNDVIVGTPGDDSLRGSEGDDSIWAGDGSDRVWGGEGNDFLAGEDGKDILRGDGGNDRLYGGALSDKLYGGSGSDRLYGQDGNDTLYGESGGDFYTGGRGTDTAERKHTDRAWFEIEAYL